MKINISLQVITRARGALFDMKVEYSEIFVFCLLFSRKKPRGKKKTTECGCGATRKVTEILKFSTKEEGEEGKRDGG